MIDPAEAQEFSRWYNATTDVLRDRTMLDQVALYNSWQQGETAKRNADAALGLLENLADKVVRLKNLPTQEITPERVQAVYDDLRDAIAALRDNSVEYEDMQTFSGEHRYIRTR